MAITTIVEGDGYTKEVTVEGNRAAQAQGKIVQDTKGVTKLQEQLGLTGIDPATGKPRNDGLLGQNTTIELQQRLAKYNETGKYDEKARQGLATSTDPKEQELGRALAAIKPGVLDQSFKPYSLDELKVTMRDLPQTPGTPPQVDAPAAVTAQPGQPPLDLDTLGQRLAELQAKGNQGAGTPPLPVQELSIGNADGYRPQSSPDIGVVIDNEAQREIERRAQAAALADSEPDQPAQAAITPDAEVGAPQASAPANPLAGKTYDGVDATIISGAATFERGADGSFASTNPTTTIQQPAIVGQGSAVLQNLDGSGAQSVSQSGLDAQFQNLMKNVIGTLKSWTEPDAVKQQDVAPGVQADASSPAMKRSLPTMEA